MKVTDIVGSWSLDSFEVTRADGSIKPWGNNSHGILIYTPEGTMSVAINSDIEGDVTDPKAQSNANLFYSGTYEVKDSTVIHHVSEASDQKRIGQDLLRDAVLKPPTLTLTGRGTFGAAVLVWRKR